MDWIKAHYDRVAVIAAALLLLLCSFSIWRNTREFAASFNALQTSGPPKEAAPPPMAIALEEADKKLKQPPQWTFSGRSGLFVPEKYFIGPNNLPATLQTSEVHPPVPNEWLEQFGLPIEEANVLEQDPDGDGFNNLTEWQGHSNPTEKNSHPDYIVALKLKAVRNESFRILFSSWVQGADGDTFGINPIDFNQPTQFLKIGDMVAGTKFKIVKFTEKYAKDQYGTDVDVSELVVEQVNSHDKLTLVKEKIATSPEPVANFVYVWPAGSPPRELQIRKEQEFSLKPVEQIKYKLVDAQPTKAVIVNIQKPDQKIEINVGP